MPAQTTIEVDARPQPAHPNPYDTVIGFMPLLMFIAAVFALLKGWAWMQDRTKRGAKQDAVIVGRLDDLEKVTKDVSANTNRLNNHETRLTVIETNNTHINTTLGELKSDIKALSENVMRAVSKKDG